MKLCSDAEFLSKTNTKNLSEYLKGEGTTVFSINYFSIDPRKELLAQFVSAAKTYIQFFVDILAQVLYNVEHKIYSFHMQQQEH